MSGYEGGFEDEYARFGTGSGQAVPLEEYDYGRFDSR
jgi:hypothetical protein